MHISPCVFESHLIISFLTWWHQQMETFFASLALCADNSPATGEFLSKRPVTQSFDVFFDLRLNKRLSKQLLCWWFDRPPCPLWRHCNANVHFHCKRHRPNSRQVTGARCTEVAARQSWAEYYSRPTTDSRHEGWAIKCFFVFSKMLTICA